MKRRSRKIRRSRIRGKQLDTDCTRAHIARNEYGEEDNREFCYGLMDRMTEEVLDKCKECKAYVYNAYPLAE